ncbi:hypothetical protein [Chiayiivirga flava]|uniref:Uncharacterized protein n=1 Tax=Chiayiivirga flava TaxID=659595 RepID=A0A7W8D7A7_9GAMM|nr:hypothetical protein [Chiayiivirga flava]MBB5208110.1 hypothetical protein [Chiayiivirga flava]
MPTSRRKTSETHASVQKFAVRMGERPTLADRLLDLVARIPTPREKKADDPAVRASHIARTAAAKSAAAAGALALPPGALGWITITPELYAVWRLQAQMVADIAGAYGKTHLLGREQMLYCLFGHTAAGAFEDLVVRVGERWLIRRTPLSSLYAVGNKVAMLIAQRSAGRMVTRWVPVVGALGVAGFVYVDTGKVADTAMELFEHDVDVEEILEAVPVKTTPRTRVPQKAAKVARKAAPRGTAANKKTTTKVSSGPSSGTATPAARKAAKKPAARAPRKAVSAAKSAPTAS